MSTLLDIKIAVANYLNRDLADLSQNGQDLALEALNQVKRMAELQNDFEFNRKLVSVTVNGTTGGSLLDAEDSNGDPVDVKTVIDVGLMGDSGNLVPVEWTTVSESLTRQRGDDRSGAWPRYPRDDETQMVYGANRFTFAGNDIRKWPRWTETDATDFTLFLEVYAFSSPWTIDDLAQGLIVTFTDGTPNLQGTYNEIGLDANGNSFYAGRGVDDIGLLYVSSGNRTLTAPTSGATWTLSSTINPVGTYPPSGSPATGNAEVTNAGPATSDVWTKYGSQYLQWATIVQLNQLFKRFVPRQEGNLPPPQALADQGLQTIIEWDSRKFEQFRTHNR